MSRTNYIALVAITSFPVSDRHWKQGLQHCPEYCIQIYTFLRTRKILPRAIICKCKFGCDGTRQRYRECERGRGHVLALSAGWTLRRVSRSVGSSLLAGTTSALTLPVKLEMTAFVRLPPAWPQNRYHTTAMASIMTFAPLGRSRTAMAARAGGVLKKQAA